MNEKDATIEKLSKALDHSDKENEKLERQLSNAKSYQPDTSIPLKRRILILADQLDEFAKDIEAGKTGDPKWMYQERFQHRVEAVRNQLDESGVRSAELDQIVINRAWVEQTSERVRLMAGDFRKLAERTSEDAH